MARMPQQEENLDADFDSQLRGLFKEATQNIEDRDAAAQRVEEEKEQEINRRVDERMAKAYVSVPQMLRPVVLGLEAVTGQPAKIRPFCRRSTRPMNSRFRRTSNCRL